MTPMSIVVNVAKNLGINSSPKATKMERVAILAVGSFNPPTIAHLRMLEAARTHLEDRNTKVIEGIMSPVADSYNSKPSLIKANHRFRMVQAATKSSDWIRADDWECTRTTWSRTIDVLTHHRNEVQTKYGSDVRLMLVVGGDLIDSFPRILPNGSKLWNSSDIIKIITDFGLLVLPREGSNPIETVEKMDELSEFSSQISLISDEVCPTSVSSTRLRTAIKNGKSIKYGTVDEVIQYIQDHNLYKD